MSSDNFKAPSQIFRWFEKMKSNYEQTINNVLNQFERQHEKQQARVDLAITQYISSLKSSHAEQTAMHQQTIAQLHQDISYFKQQISQQQSTIEQLNARYDTVMSSFIQQKPRDIDIKAIFADDDLAVNSLNTASVGYSHVSEEEVNSNKAQPVEVETHDHQQVQESINGSPEPQTDLDNDTFDEKEYAESLFNQAKTLRESGEFEQAIPLFKKAASLGCLKSRGAIGRAFFLAEGVEENPALGLAWLMTAADAGLPQAVARVEHFQEADPTLILTATQLKQAL